jgi:hypothetical protein
MTRSLYRYLDIKMHELIRHEDVTRILVTGSYDRTSGISGVEKKGKLFNVHRPTAELAPDKTLIVKCYPGRDYVRHYAALIQTCCNLGGDAREVRYMLPTEQECWSELIQSNINEVPVADVAIIGSGLDRLTSSQWHFGQPFSWASDRLKNMSVTFIGCKYSYWSYAGGRLVAYLGELGFKRVIYVGKLGALQPEVVPNEFLATGNMSAVEDEIARWTNVFAGVKRENLIHGTHCNCPGVMMETKEWVKRHREYDFVDSEIGQMGKFAVAAKVQFSYLHFVSDNVVKKYDEDLSNERIQMILEKRREVVATMKSILYEME